VKLSIRQADLTRASDSAAIVTVLDSYARDVMGGGEPLSPDVRARLPQALRDHPTTVAFLASDDVEPVGVAVCFVGFSTFHARPLLNIHDLAVVPDRRGQGIGRALLQAAEAEARRRGCCKLTLEVRDDNARARRLYDGFGFTDFVVAQTTAPTRFLAKSLDEQH
jgi:ribosomal protein S18 acetylase RimI-like enzyme